MTSSVVTGSKGAKDYVTGYAVLENGTIHAASKMFNSSDSSRGYSFYTIDPESSVATDVGTLVHKADEQDPGFYGGYHRGIDVEGETAYRMGYKIVSAQAAPGMSVVKHGRVAEWYDIGSVDNNHAFYLSMVVLQDGIGKTGLSIAPR